MSNNPYVNIEKVIDTNDGQKRRVDFLHQKRINNTSLTISDANRVILSNADGEFYQDFTVSGIKNTHLAIVILNTNAATYLDRSNFTTCYVLADGKLRLHWKNAIISGSTLVIPTILLVETAGTAPIRGMLSGAGGSSGGSTDWVFDINDLPIFRSYLAALGTLTGDISDLQDIIDSFAASFSTGVLNADAIIAGTIDANKLTIHGPNLLTDFDSFEQFTNKTLLGPSSTTEVIPAVIEYADVISTYSYHGKNSLRIRTAVSGSNFYKYINPLTSTATNWLTIDNPGDYIFSYYIKTPSVGAITGSIQLYDIVGGAPVITVPFTGLTSSDGWKRYYNTKLTISTAKNFTIKINLNNTGTTIYIDALQLEKVDAASTAPAAFSAGGTTTISGDNITTGNINANLITTGELNASLITTGTLDASTITVNNLSADSIVTGTLDAEIITVTNLDAGSITTGTLSADRISGGTIDATLINVENLDAGNITTGTLDASRISANSIDASRLKVTGSNLISQFDSFEGLNGSTIYGSSNNVSSISIGSEQAYHGVSSLKIITSGTNAYHDLSLNDIQESGSSDNFISILDFESYIFSYYVKAAGTYTGKVILYSYEFPATTFEVPFTITAADGWKRFYLKFTNAIKGNYLIRVYINENAATVFFDGLQLERAYSSLTPINFIGYGSVVIDGGYIGASTIGAEQIKADAIEAESIKAGSITANHLSSNFGNFKNRLAVGDGSNQVIISGETDYGKIYTGEGNFGTSGTGFYLGSNGEFSLSNQLIFTPSNADTLSDLTINGKIRGIIESVTPIPSNKLNISITSIVVAGEVATLTTSSAHALVAGESIIIEGMVNTFFNKVFIINNVPDNTHIIFEASIADGTYSGGTPTLSLREITLGFHPIEGIGSYLHDAGSGLRLDKYNWWFTNNQFRVGNSSNYLKWKDGSLQMQGSGSKKIQIGLGSGDENNYIAISDSAVIPTYGAANTQLYADSLGQFSLGDKLTYQNGNLNIIGTLGITSQIKVSDSEFISPADLSNSLNDISNMFNDLYLTPVEKKAIKKEIEEIKEEYPKNISQAANLNVVDRVNPITITGNLISGQKYISNIVFPIGESFNSLSIYQGITGTGIASNTYIAGINPMNKTILMSNAATINGTAVSIATKTFKLNQDYSSTFTTLNDYLYNLIEGPTGDLLYITSPIDGSFLTNFKNYYVARMNLLNAITAAAKNEALNDIMGAYGDKLVGLDTNFTFDDTGLTISKNTESFSLRIDNDSMSFYSGPFNPQDETANRMAFIDNDEFYFEKGRVGSELLVGVHQIEKYDTGTQVITLFRYLGE